MELAAELEATLREFVSAAPVEVREKQHVSAFDQPWSFNPNHKNSFPKN